MPIAGKTFSMITPAISIKRRKRPSEILNPEVIRADLQNNWAVVAEAIQTVLRREGFHKPYEALLDLTRTNNKITRESINEFIDNLDISTDLKAELKSITPFNFTGF